jgi:hypothetical protein
MRRFCWWAKTRTAAPVLNNISNREDSTRIMFWRFPSPPGVGLIGVGVTVGVGRNEGAVVVGVGLIVGDRTGVVELVGV